jgi:1-deoxy-D-xylulose-5-phosphate synthase
MGIPDSFVEHGTPEQLYRICGMDADSVLAAIMEFNKK